MKPHHAEHQLPWVVAKGCEKCLDAMLNIQNDILEQKVCLRSLAPKLSLVLAEMMHCE
jgi:hypothetical protein